MLHTFAQCIFITHILHIMYMCLDADLPLAVGLELGAHQNSDRPFEPSRWNPSEISKAYSVSTFWGRWARCRAKVDGFVPRSQHVNL